LTSVEFIYFIILHNEMNWFKDNDYVIIHEFYKYGVKWDKCVVFVVGTGMGWAKSDPYKSISHDYYIPIFYKFELYYLFSFLSLKDT